MFTRSLSNTIIEKLEILEISTINKCYVVDNSNSLIDKLKQYLNKLFVYNCINIIT